MTWPRDWRVRLRPGSQHPALCAHRRTSLPLTTWLSATAGTENHERSFPLQAATLLSPPAEGAAPAGRPRGTYPSSNSSPIREYNCRPCRRTGHLEAGADFRPPGAGGSPGPKSALLAPAWLRRAVDGHYPTDAGYFAAADLRYGRALTRGAHLGRAKALAESQAGGISRPIPGP